MGRRRRGEKSWGVHSDVDRSGGLLLPASRSPSSTSRPQTKGVEDVELPTNATGSENPEKSPALAKSKSPSSSIQPLSTAAPQTTTTERASTPASMRNVSAGNCSRCRESSVSPNAAPMNKSPQTIGPQLRKTSPERSAGDDSARGSVGDVEHRVFNICRPPSSGGVKLKKSLLEINRLKRKEAQCSKDASLHVYLREGMILLKKYLSHDDQVKIVKKCQEVGIGEGGFYRPGYADGAKLRLQMMCLGKNWDPESRKYIDRRPFDGATPPEIPEEFKKLVEGAIKVSHDVIMQKYSCTAAEEELPWMSPDICIVNFYSNDGKLGLHQDRDESEDSLRKGLPVVSFSIGDSAEFLYGDGRDENVAQKVLLESGDVLIFGGKSRWIFHGVPCITKNTAPSLLTEKCNLKPGRLNLTFRKY